MSYPKKISRETVLACAMSYIEDHGMADLSMRTLATLLGVTPNALYRYFASKGDLEFAMADEGGRMLLASLTAATEGCSPPDAIRAAAKAYVRFARRYPELYALKMHHSASDGHKPGSHDEVWQFVMDMASGLPTPWPARDLALSLWAFLHGTVALHRASLLEGRDPEDTVDVGLDVMLRGLMASMTSGS
jgi:AcrR family transcriptional regulator